MIWNSCNNFQTEVPESLHLLAKESIFRKINFSVLAKMHFLHVQHKYAYIIAIYDVTWLPHRYSNFKDYWYVCNFSCVYKCCLCNKIYHTEISMIPAWCHCNFFDAFMVLQMGCWARTMESCVSGCSVWRRRSSSRRMRSSVWRVHWPMSSAG